MLRFKPDWLQDEYNTEAKVDQHPNITGEQKRALKGFLQRKGKGLAQEISKTDCDFIAEAYYGKMCTLANTFQVI